jgi:carbon monoxide dehydrogenase subunit G
MRRITATRDVAVPPEVAFDRLAAFESCAEWDPGVVAARRLDDGPPAVGTRFDVTSVFLGNRVPMTYVLETVLRPTRLRLVGHAEQSTAHDTLTFTPIPGGTCVTWTLELEMKGLARLSEPFLGPFLARLARKALDGLAADLGPLP